MNTVFKMELVEFLLEVADFYKKFNEDVKSENCLKLIEKIEEFGDDPIEEIVYNAYLMKWNFLVSTDNNPNESERVVTGITMGEEKYVNAISELFDDTTTEEVIDPKPTSKPKRKYKTKSKNKSDEGNV